MGAITNNPAPSSIEHFLTPSIPIPLSIIQFHAHWLEIKNGAISDEIAPFKVELTVTQSTLEARYVYCWLGNAN